MTFTRLHHIVALVLILAAATASAEELTILGPVGPNATDVAAVKAALVRANVGKLGSKQIDENCATDPGCLTTAGSEIAATRVLAIYVVGPGKLTLMLVDVPARALVGTRDIVIAEKKLTKELGPMLVQTVEQLTVDKAKALFAEGNQHYNVGEFKQALDRYKLAYRLKPLPAFQFNIAQCHRKLGQHKDAIAMYQAYLVGVPDATNKTIVDGLIAESNKALGDQEAMERARLETEQKKAIEDRKTKEAEANAAAERAKVEQAHIAAEREREQSYDRHPARKWMIVAGSLGLATAGVGGYFGWQAREEERNFDRDCQRDALLLSAELATCQRYLDRGERDANLANVLIASGGAVALGGVIIYLLDPGNVERPTRTVHVTPTSVDFTVRW